MVELDLQKNKWRAGGFNPRKYVLVNLSVVDGVLSESNPYTYVCLHSHLRVGRSGV